MERYHEGMRRIYMDHQATTPLDPRVLEAMMPYLTGSFGNASSQHVFGWEAAEAVKTARARVASAIGAEPEEIVWTSGATEAINLALKGAAEALQAKGKHLVSLVTEHPATLDTLQALAARGWSITLVPVASSGLVDPAAIMAALRPDTVLVSVLHANNEIGVVQNLAAIGAVVKGHGALMHVDAAQSFTKLPIDVRGMGIDLMSMSGHKIYGPKGVGALFVRRRGPRVRLEAQQHGGGHERGMRSGTLNVPGIVGMGAATTLALAEQEAEALRLVTLRDRLHRQLEEALPGVRLHGDLDRRLPGNLSLGFELAPAANIIGKLPGIAVSNGAACSSARLAPSHVLAALGIPDALALSTLRFGLGRTTTEAEVDEVARAVVEAVRQVRQDSPLAALWEQGFDVGPVLSSTSERPEARD